jgi:hypothetical protein
MTLAKLFRRGCRPARRFTKTVRPLITCLEVRSCPSALAFSTYLGGTANDQGLGVAIDAAGNSYVTGATTSTDFPVTPGAYDTTFNGASDAYVAKYDPSGTLLWATYLGGSGDEAPTGIAVDGSGDVYVTGQTGDASFPTTAGAFQTSIHSSQDGFVAKINATGTALVYSTFLGGSGADYGGFGMAVDSSGDAYIGGSTRSSDFPTTPGAFRPSKPGFGGVNSATVTELNPSGSALVFSTYLGGTSSTFNEGVYGIAVDVSGSVYVTGVTSAADFPATPGAFETSLPGGGNQIFMAKFNSSGSALLYSTYLGSSGGTSAVNGGVGGLAIDGAGNAYITGDTNSSNFPTTPGAFQTAYGGGSSDAFVSELNAAGTALVFSTYLGGSGDDFAPPYGGGISMDAAGDVSVVGRTTSMNFPTTNALQPAYGGGTSDAYVTRLSAGGAGLAYSTYLGGSGAEDYVITYGGLIAVDPAGNAYVTGATSSTDFPTASASQSNNAGSVDAFVAKITNGGPLPAPSSLSGLVWKDFNNDGQVDFGENGIGGVTITIAGADDLGPVNLSQVTATDGTYLFQNLRPGTYHLTETQPAGYLQGIDSVGTAGGSLVGTDDFSIPLGAGVDGMNYNFGEQPAATGPVHKGQTAGIGFWNNKNGQSLIKSFNGGVGTALADWLAATMPNTFGVYAGANNLTAKNNAAVASLFQQDFVLKGPKVEAQMFATALSVYATNATLDSTGIAAHYGFTVSGDGVGTAGVNVGNAGDAFGMANNTTMTVMDLLLAADAQSVNGVLYGGNSHKRAEATDVFGAINDAGGI